MQKFNVTGMTCSACQAHVQKAVEKVDGVTSVNVALLTNSMTVEGSASDEAIIDAVIKAGYGASVEGKNTQIKEQKSAPDSAVKTIKNRLVISAAFLVLLMYITMGHGMLNFPLPFGLETNPVGLGIIQMVLAIIIMFINRVFFVNGVRSLLHGAPTMDTLVSMGSGVSFAWSFYELMKMSAGGEGVHELYMNLYFESAAMILVFITIGKLLEAISKGRTTDALKELIAMKPKTATVIRDGKEINVNADDVVVGDIYIVKPGGAIPVDGVIVEGACAVDESSLTGESIPVDKVEGDSISAATINKSGYIKARATRVGEDTNFASIIKMVTEASTSKAPIARIADKVSAIFVPCVIVIAAITTIIWLVLGREVSFALTRGISVLVISCPCALGLATPVAIMVGSGVGARHGILYKNAAALETAGKVKAVALDKTGTITVGKPEVTDVVPAQGVSRDKLITTVVDLESRSEHPLARAIVNYFSDITPRDVSDYEEIPGKGVRAISCDGSIVRAGSADAMGQENTLGKTAVFVKCDDEYLGAIYLADKIADGSIKAISDMHKMGIRTVMITGDNEAAANAIASQAGIDYVEAGVLPDKKAQTVESLRSLGKVMMIGDGINDAPALVTADVGAAIGAGTDVAISSADIVLMRDGIQAAADAVNLSRATLRNIYENLGWAFGYNVILIPVAALSTMKPMWGAAAMALSSFTVCMNALRLNLWGRKNNRKNNNITNIQEEKTMSKTITIEGMMCPMCEKHTREALSAIPGTTVIEVSHEKKVAVVETTADDATLIAAVNGAGYKATGVQ